MMMMKRLWYVCRKLHVYTNHNLWRCIFYVQIKWIRLVEASLLLSRFLFLYKVNLLLGFGGVILICLCTSAGDAVVGDCVGGCSDPASSVDPPSNRDRFPGGCSSLGFSSDLMIQIPVLVYQIQMSMSIISQWLLFKSLSIRFLNELIVDIFLPLSFWLGFGLVIGRLLYWLGD